MTVGDQAESEEPRREEASSGSQNSCGTEHLVQIQDRGGRREVEWCRAVEVRVEVELSVAAEVEVVESER